MSIIVECLRVSKKYTLSPVQGYTTLVETLTHRWRRATKALCGKHSKDTSPPINELWALKDCDLQIMTGDRVGLLGRNGAGKSTLLKLLSRITIPTSGFIKVHGRVASLLEVGTGFHLELTGRENIFLNGAILGMTKKEIARKFDEIAAFAEIENFLDVPVKRFSSGMYMRLGFAIAAHVDPDLLIVDEVLAVGDISFQAKCLKKLNHLSACGTTILFVSHDAGAILNLCNKGILLEKGAVQAQGGVQECLNIYMQKYRSQNLCWQGNDGNAQIRFYRLALQNNDLRRQFFYNDDQIQVVIDYEILQICDNFIIGLEIRNLNGQILANSHIQENEIAFATSLGIKQAIFNLNGHYFHPGEYTVHLSCLLPSHSSVISNDICVKLVVYSQTTTNPLLPNSPTTLSLGNGWQSK